MNNNFMGFFDPTHSGMGMGPDFGRGPPGQQGGFGGLPPNMNPHGGLNMPGFQHHPRMPHYEGNHMMGPLSPGLPGMPSGSAIGPPPSGRLMDMNLARLQHYRAAQQSHLQHSPGSLSPMPSIGLTNQSPYGLRMPNLAPKQQMMEPRLQSSLGNGISRWPRMPGASGLTRPQMPQLMMNQGPMPMLQNANDFQLVGSPSLSSADMLRYMKMDTEDNYPGPGMNSFDFPSSHQFHPNQNPYSIESPLDQPPSLKQSGGSQMSISQSPLSFGQPQSLSYGPPPVSKSFIDSYSKFSSQMPHSPKLTHFGPSPTNDIFDQPPNPMTPLTSQQKSPFSPFGNTFNDNLNSPQPMGLRNMPHPLPMQSSSPVMQTSSLNLRSPTKMNPLLAQYQHLKQQIVHMEENPMQQGSPQLPILKQQLDQTYMQYINQQRSADFPSIKETSRVPQPPPDFFLDKPPMTPRPHSDFSLDKPPPTPRPHPSMNDFPLDKMPKHGPPLSQSDFLMERSLSQPHLNQDFLVKKSPQTPIGPPHHDIFDKPPMTPRPPPQHDFLMEKSHLPPGDFALEKVPVTPRQKSQQGFAFGRPQFPLSQSQMPVSHPDLPLSQSQGLPQSQPNYFDKPPSTPRPQPMQQDTMLDKPQPLPPPNTTPDFLLDKVPSTPGQLSSSQSQPPSFNMVKSPVRTQAPTQLPLQQQSLQQQPPQQTQVPVQQQQQPPQRPTHIPLQSPLQSPPSFFSQASQSPMSSISTPIQSVSQQQDPDMDLKDDIAFLDELFQAKLNEPPEKQEILNPPSTRKNSLNRASNPMPVLDGMHSSVPSPTIPPTMPVLAPSVPPPSPMPKYDNQFLGSNQGMPQMNQSPISSMPMPFSMQMPNMSMPMGMPGMQEMPHPMMMPGLFGPNYNMMPSVKPPQLRQPNNKEKTRAPKNAGPKTASGLAPAAKKKKVRRKSSESDTLVQSPKSPVTPATPNPTSNASIVNPSSNVSSVHSGESIAAVNPFMLDDALADNAATRRSLRERKKKNYNDDYDYNISDEEEKKKGENGEPLTGPPSIPGGHKLIAYKPSDAVEGEIATIERILAGRIRSNIKDEEGNDIEDEEFCVKYKGYSYLHCEWGTEKELTKKDKRAPMKIKRFKAKRDPVAILSELDDEPFNPDFVEVDRVLDQSTCLDQVTGDPVTHYLVKWRSLPYEDSTWELEVNVDEPKIKQYLELKKPPPAEFQQYIARPQAFQWKKIDKSPEYKDGNTLRDYQLEGLNWLTFCWYKRQNCILADEMGLGKTVQSISLLCELKRFGVRGPFLIIAPLSTIVHWQREFEAWTDINTIVYHGSSPSRLLIQQYEMSYTDEKGEKITGFYKFEAVVTTYEMILSDNDMLSKIPWRCAVIDEAHRLKNRNCKLLEGLNKLQLEHRVLLTGTPLQNNVEELFSLLNFLEPNRFPSQAAFLLEFGDLKTEAQVEKLQQILKPMMLRRLKEDVEKNVPPKEETIIEVELTTIQKKFYRAILEKNFAFLTRGLSVASNTPNLMNAMMELRKCCNHPFLINGAEERIVSDYTNGAEGMEKITLHFKAMTESSGKMVLIDKLLPKLKAGGHKVLIFSQMIRVLDLLEDYLLCKKYLYERIDGRVRGTARQTAIDRFCRADTDRFVFLLCTRAGGLGINLTAADTVIIFDSDWNPQNDLQAQARCHRIGQNKPVKIYRLICRNTYEREMFDKASRKLALDRAVLQNMNSRENFPVSSLPGNTIPGGAIPGTTVPGGAILDNPLSENAVPGNPSPGNPAQVQPQPLMSKKEVEDLLKRGAYGALMDEDGDASSKFCEEDIDQILERRTQIIQILGEGKGSTFAKASFVSNTAKMDIDVDDPEFWSKWAQKAAIDVTDIEENLIIDKPRERKQTKRFGNEDGTMELSDAESGEEEEKPVVDVPRSSWSRVECFRVEKNLLVYGWGRWHDFLVHDNFKVQVHERELEAIARTILAFCLHHFKGDEKVKSFIISTITKSVAQSPIIARDPAVKDNIIKDEPYTPESADPTKPKKVAKQIRKGVQNSKPVLVEAGPDWQTVDPETLIIESSYSKHLTHHSKKILSRVRLLHCLRHEIIGNVGDKILLGLPASDIPLQVPHVDGEAPTPWWDAEADKSLLIGVFKHGYDKYNAIRADPCLCFANKLRLSAAEIEKLSAISPEHGSVDRHDDDGINAPGKRKRKRKSQEDDDFNSDLDDIDRDDDAESLSMIESPQSSASPHVTSEAGHPHAQASSLKWPQTPDLNTRLRRLVAGYLKGCEKEQMKQAQAEKEKERRERQAQLIREKQLKRAEMALRWSRREVTDFYRVATTYGIIYDEETKEYDWSKFRKLAKLERKDDERITAYYEEFVAMCRRVCNKSTPEDIETKKGENLEPISDERANRVLHRAGLLQTIRKQVLPHEKLDERLALCEPSNDFPVWWKPGEHDKEFLIGVAKHGIGRTDFHLFTDESLCFKGILDSLAVQLKKRKQEQRALHKIKQESAEVLPSEQADNTPPVTNSTAADSQTTSSSETPSSGVNADRQPVATQHRQKPMSTSEEKEEFPDSVSDEVAEILAAWPKDKALLGRLEKICHCVLNNSWPRNPRMEPSRSHGHSHAGQNHAVTLPGAFDRTELMRQPAATVGGEDGPRGEMAEGLLSPDKNFKVTSLDGLKITVKKKRRRRTKEQMAAAAAAAQLGQVPPPEHLSFSMNDMQMPMAAKDKVKRRRKRKGDMMEIGPPAMNSQSSSDEPPLKVVPHPMKYTQAPETGPTDLQMPMNPSIILHVPANMDQRTSRIPSSLTSPTSQTPPNLYNATSLSNQNSERYVNTSEKPNITASSISHSIDSLVHSNSKSSSGHTPAIRTSTVEHLPRVSRQLSNESPTDFNVRNTVFSRAPSEISNASPMKETSIASSQRDVKMPRSISNDYGEAPRKPNVSSGGRFIEHPAIVSPNVNPFEKRRSVVGESNIFDMLPMHMHRHPSSKDANEAAPYSKTNAMYGIKSSGQKHDTLNTDERETPPAITKYFEGHKASAAIAALAAKLHSQAAVRSHEEKSFTTTEHGVRLPSQNDISKSDISPVMSMNMSGPPNTVAKHGTMSYKKEAPESGPVRETTQSPISSGCQVTTDSLPNTTKSSSETKGPLADANKFKKSIVGHPHSMASLLSSHPSSKATSTQPNVTPPLNPVQSPPLSMPHSTAREAWAHTSSDQQARTSHPDQNRPMSTIIRRSSSDGTSKHSHYPVFMPTSHHTAPQEIPGQMSVKKSPITTVHMPMKPVMNMTSGMFQSKTTATTVTTATNIHHQGNVPARVKSPSSRNRVVKSGKTGQAKSVIKRASPVNAPSSVVSMPSSTYCDGSMKSPTVTQKFDDMTASGIMRSSSDRNQLPVSSRPQLPKFSSQTVLPESSKIFPQGRDPKNDDKLIEKRPSATSSVSPMPVSKPLSVTAHSDAVVSSISRQATPPQRSAPSQWSTPSQQQPATSFQEKPSVTQPAASSVIASRASPLSVIKSSVSSHSIVSSHPAPANVSVITPLTGLMRVVDAASQRAAASSVARTHPGVGTLSGAHGTSVIAAASPSSKPSKSIESSSAVSLNITRGLSSKQISVQIMTATTSVVACLTGATFSQVAERMQPSSGKQQTLSQTSVVSTILKVIPSVGTKSDSPNDAKSSKQVTGVAMTKPVSTASQIISRPTSKVSSRPTSSASQVSSGPASAVSQVGSRTNGSKISLTTAQSISSATTTTTLKAITIVPITMATKVTTAKDLVDAKKSTVQNSSTQLQLLTTVSCTANSPNHPPNTQTKSSNQKTTSAKQQKTTSSSRSSSKGPKASVSTPVSEDESNTNNNAPVASRTRPSTRRNTTLSALGPGPSKKPFKGSAVSPAGSSGSKSQTTSPTGLKNVPETIPGIMKSKGAVKQNVQPTLVPSGNQKGNTGKQSSSQRKTMQTDTISVGSRKADSSTSNEGVARSQVDARGSVSSSQTSQSKVESSSYAAAALAKLNESIVIPSTRPVTSVPDRPKPQKKKSLASIVNLLASKTTGQQSVVESTKASELSDGEVTASEKGMEIPPKDGVDKPAVAAEIDMTQKSMNFSQKGIASAATEKITAQNEGAFLQKEKVCNPKYNEPMAVEKAATKNIGETTEKSKDFTQMKEPTQSNKVVTQKSKSTLDKVKNLAQKCNDLAQKAKSFTSTNQVVTQNSEQVVTENSVLDAQKSVQGTQKSVSSAQKSAQGAQKSLQGVQKSIQGVQKSIQGVQKSVQVVKKSKEVVLKVTRSRSPVVTNNEKESSPNVKRRATASPVTVKGSTRKGAESVEKRDDKLPSKGNDSTKDEKTVTQKKVEATPKGNIAGAAVVSQTEKAEPRTDSSLKQKDKETAQKEKDIPQKGKVQRTEPILTPKDAKDLQTDEKKLPQREETKVTPKEEKRPGLRVEVKPTLKEDIKVVEKNDIKPASKDDEKTAQKSVAAPKLSDGKNSEQKADKMLAVAADKKTAQKIDSPVAEEIDKEATSKGLKTVAELDTKGTAKKDTNKKILSIEGKGVTLKKKEGSKQNVIASTSKQNHMETDKQANCSERTVTSSVVSANIKTSEKTLTSEKIVTSEKTLTSLKTVTSQKVVTSEQNVT